MSSLTRSAMERMEPQRDLASARGIVLPRFARRPVRQVIRLFDGDVQANRSLLAGSLALATMIGAGGMIQIGAFDGMVGKLSAVAGIRIGDVQVTGGREVTKIDVLSALDLGADRSLFAFDVHKAREDLKKLPWVYDAKVAKTYPDTLKIQLTERVPHAVWQRGDELWLIARDGQEITPFDDRFAGLPLVVGPGANEFAAQIMTLVGRYPRIAERVNAYVRVGLRRWNLVFKNGMTVMLPEAGVEQALIDLTEMDRSYDLFKRAVTSVDMRIDDRLVLKLTEDGRKAYDEAFEARTGRSRARSSAL